MKSGTEYIVWNAETPRECVRPTGRVGAIVKDSGIRERLALVSAMHITAAIYAEFNGPRPKRVVVKVIGE